MNAIGMLASQPWVERLGATLLHFLWQGLAIAAVYAAARRAVSSPTRRYALACLALTLMICAPAATWLALSPQAPQPTANSFAAPLSVSGHRSASALSAIVPVAFAERAAEPLFVWAVVIWLVGAVTFWLRLMGGWAVAVRLRSQSVRPAPAEWQHMLDRLTARLSMARPVRLLVSTLAQGPAVVGWLRPVILVPAGALAGLSAAQLEALLVHELAHIRRHDYLVSILQGTVEALLFYHPAVWWVSGHIRADRELCCDDLAVAVTGDAVGYARALVEVASAQRSFGMAMAATGGPLTTRIARLLGQPRPDRELAFPSSALAAAALVAATGFVVLAQTATKPQFEAASIKPAPEAGFMRVRPQPGRLTATASLKLLMQNAYTVQPFQIVGAPGWADSDRFEIDAKAAGTATRADMFRMLQSLLEERFQLRTHRESKEMPVYALVPARGGLKLPAPNDGNCTKPAPTTAAENEWAGGGRMMPPGNQPPPLPPCGSVSVQLAPSGAQMQGGAVQMPELIRILSMVMGRSVVDRTGFTGEFDIKLAFLPDQLTGSLPPPPPDAAATMNSPSIVTALQEQLGLRLESSRAPVDVLVVDRVEKPSAN